MDNIILKWACRTTQVFAFFFFFFFLIFLFPVFMSTFLFVLIND
jgi:hypothetical protein